MSPKGASAGVLRRGRCVAGLPSPLRSSRRFLLPALLLPGLLRAAPGPPQDPPSGFDPVATASELRSLRAQAQDPALAIEAVLALTGILDALDARRDRRGALPELEGELFLRALEYRSRAHLARGARAQAADDLRILILQDPAWRLDLTDLSPAVLDLFEEQRGQLLAYLNVVTEPPGATVLVEGEPIGETPVVGRPVFAGVLDVRLERPGYAPLTEAPREVLAGEIVEIERELERTGPVLSVITAPAGATVRVGGRVVGTTGGELPGDLRPLVPPRFAGEEFSAPLALAGLSLGPNEIALEAPCRRPARFTFHADEARDHLPRFVRLRPSTGGLRIESEPSGGRVLLDGEERGVTPLAFSAMCAGDHRVEILHPAGRCARSFSVSRGSRTAVRCEVFPVLALAPDETAPDPAPETAIHREVLRALEAAPGFFFVEGRDEDAQARVALVIPEAGEGPARIEFRAAGSLVPDIAGFDRFAPGAATAAVERLLAPPVRRRPWIGLTATIGPAAAPDEPRRPLVVSGIHPEGPAMLAGIERGDEILELEGRSASDELALAEITAATEPGQALDILVRRAGAARPLRLVAAETPVLPSRGGGRCNRRLVGLEADFARGLTDPNRHLEAAACWILLGDPSRALLHHLNEIVAPFAAGIGEGTALYYRGLALAAAGEREPAARAFEAAAAVPGATLVTHDGPVLAPLAERRARMLGLRPRE